VRTDANGSADLLTVLEAAALMRCGRTRVFGLLRDGDLPSTKVGRARLIPRRAIDEYLEQQFERTPTADPEPVSSRV
jgi:excisionase family DNA binding protein